MINLHQEQLFNERVKRLGRDCGNDPFLEKLELAIF